jgi:hypothetical protein
MKRFLFLAYVVVGLVLPLSAFATTHFMDMFIGAGTTAVSGQYSGWNFGSQPYDVYNSNVATSTSTFDFVFGMDYFWVLNHQHTFCMGIGSTLSMAFPASGSVSPETISLDVPFVYLFSTHFSVVAKPSILGIWMPADLTNYYYEDLFGVGFEISAGPTYYFDEHENYGVCLLVGYKYLPTSCTNDDGTKTTFAGGGFYASVYFSFELWSN